jgi:DNA-binding NtrC family response regulator
VALNCGAIAESLQESELFAHERGAFTGAVALYRGRFEQAHGGTLFLDEVGELSPAVQTRLLRVLQEGTLQRLGGHQMLAVDVRVIAATHRNLETLIADGRFREDLYYRLVVFPIAIPPLRERAEDLPLLVSHLVRKHEKALGAGPVTFEPDAIDVLCRYDWPGNVRELENVVVRVLVSKKRGRIAVDDLPAPMVLRAMGVVQEGEAPSAAEPGDGIIPLAALEERAIRHALRVLDGNISLAAKRLGLGRATLYRKASKLGQPSEG